MCNATTAPDQEGEAALEARQPRRRGNCRRRTKNTMRITASEASSGTASDSRLT